MLGRPRGIRIGEESDRDGQYFHYLAMWIFALDRLGAIDSRYRDKAIALVRAIHPRLRRPRDRGHLEDARGPERPLPGFRAGRAGCLSRAGGLSPPGPGVGWRKRSRRCESVWSLERSRAVRCAPTDLGLGMMLWMSQLLSGRALGRAPARAGPRHAGPRCRGPRTPPRADASSGRHSRRHRRRLARTGRARSPTAASDVLGRSPLVRRTYDASACASSMRRVLSGRFRAGTWRRCIAVNAVAPRC